MEEPTILRRICDQDQLASDTLLPARLAEYYRQVAADVVGLRAATRQEWAECVAAIPRAEREYLDAIHAEPDPVAHPSRWPERAAWLEAIKTWQERRTALWDAFVSGREIIEAQARRLVDRGRGAELELKRSIYAQLISEVGEMATVKQLQIKAAQAHRKHKDALDRVAKAAEQAVSAGDASAQAHDVLADVLANGHSQAAANDKVAKVKPKPKGKSKPVPAPANKDQGGEEDGDASEGE